MTATFPIRQFRFDRQLTRNQAAIERPIARRRRLLVTVLWGAIAIVALGVGPRLAHAQTSASTPGIKAQAGSRQSPRPAGMANRSRFSYGERAFQEWYDLLSYLGYLGVSVAAVVAAIFQRNSAAPCGDVNEEAVREANAHAATAAAHYRKLAAVVNRRNFAERRAALAAEGSAAETLFRRAAGRFAFVADQFHRAAIEKPADSRRALILAKAYGDRAASQTAMAKAVAMLADTSVKTAEEFIRRAGTLLAAAKQANEHCERLLNGTASA